MMRWAGPGAGSRYVPSAEPCEGPRPAARSQPALSVLLPLTSTSSTTHGHEHCPLPQEHAALAVRRGLAGRADEGTDTRRARRSDGHWRARSGPAVGRGGAYYLALAPPITQHEPRPLLPPPSRPCRLPPLRSRRAREARVFWPRRAFCGNYKRVFPLGFLVANERFQYGCFSGWNPQWIVK